MRKEIITRSIEDEDIKQFASYDGRIIFVDNLQMLNDSHPNVKVEAFVAVLCLKGKASLFVNDKFHEIHENELFICHPNIILGNSMSSIDFKYRCICLAPEYVKQLAMIAPNLPNSWDIHLFLEKTPILTLSPEEVRTFCWYYDLLKFKSTSNNYTNKKQLMDALFMAFLYEFRNTIERLISLTPPTYKSSESLFKAFIDNISASYPKARSVSHYAKRLHVTPKYLSAVCKQISGHPASYLIDQYVIKDIHFQLLRTEKSIKEIANELDFPNISFFGKYVKKHLGVSPRQFRDKQKELS